MRKNLTQLRANELYKKQVKSSSKTKKKQKNSKISFEKNPELIAKVTTEPKFIAAITIDSLVKKTNAISELKNELESQVEAFKNGNSEYLEEVLLTQVITLNTAFNGFLKQGEAIMLEPSVMTAFPHLPESLMKLALKCQDQSRQTIRTLAELKNPKKPTQFIKNYVDKQVNQLKVETSGEIEQLKQIGENNNAQVDIRSQSQTSRAYSEMAALD